MKKILLTLTILLALASCTIARSPSGTTTTTRRATTTTTTRPPTASNFEWVFGASTEAQLVSTGINAGDGRTWKVENGAPLNRWGNEINWAIGSTPNLLVFTSGLAVNGAINGGWTQADADYWNSKLRLVSPLTCVVITLPMVTEVAEAGFPGLGSQVEAARQFLSTINGRNVVTVDVTSIATPEDFADGIHFGNNDVLAEYYNLINNAERSCGV